MVCNQITALTILLILAPVAMSNRVSCLVSVPHNYSVEESATAQQDGPAIRIHLNFERVQVSGRNYVYFGNITNFRI